MSKLFLIGNGFDIDHDLKTAYEDFRQYLLKNNSEINMDSLIMPEETMQPDGGLTYNEDEVISLLFYLINEAESNTEKWSNIEHSLGYLNFDEAFEWGDILDKEGDIDLPKMASRNEGIASQLKIPTLTIQSLFSEWVDTIELDLAIPKEDFRRLIDCNALFLTFNYTGTLEEVYEILEEKVCHIHGKQGEEIFFGHGNVEDNTDLYMRTHIGSQDGLNEINQQLRKRTEAAMDNNQDFFDNLVEIDVKEIYSYGFSFSEVDKIYLEEICNNIDTRNIIWYFNDYDEGNHSQYEMILEECGYRGVYSTFHIEN
ncbi:TPA: bacteriophage abortive infection AbiH family protein [Bacillus thuringiensis]|nr:bacteriophage abortive infection AbiH family protein [Bacillus thuringiensis]